MKLVWEKFYNTVSLTMPEKNLHVHAVTEVQTPKHF